MRPDPGRHPRDPVRSHGAGWHSLGAVDPATVGNWVEEVAAARLSCPQGRYVAGAFLGAQLARAVLVAPTLALATERRAPDVAGPNLAVHRGADATIDGVALVRPRFGALRGDPAAAHPDAVVFEEMAALREWVAERAGGTLAPLFSAIRGCTGYSVRARWGQAADRVGGAVWSARRLGADAALMERVWQEGVALIDRLSAYAPALVVRPSRLVVEWSGGTEVLSVRGTCCLYRRRSEAQVDPGHPCCRTCPIQSSAGRLERVGLFLEEEAARHRAAAVAGRV